MWLAALNLLLVSGPIRKKLWMANLAFLAALGLCVLLTFWLTTPEATERVCWAFPLRGRWLRRLFQGLLLASALFCLFLFITSGLGFFVFFPWLAS